MTIPTQRILQALLEDPQAEHYGAQLADQAELASGTVHPILARLEGAGWVSSAWEDVDPRVVRRPPRRYYQLTGEGAVAAREALARAYRPRRAVVAPTALPEGA